MFDKIELKDAVRRAIQTEKNAMDFYLRGAELMQNAEARKVFELLAREEREHAEWFHNVYPGDDIADLQEFPLFQLEDVLLHLHHLLTLSRVVRVNGGG